MATLRIQNVGPIADMGGIGLAPVYLFIGKRSSGKSTLLKILCACRWIDNQVAIGGTINTSYDCELNFIGSRKPDIV